MKYRWHVIAGVLAVIVAVFSLVLLRTSAQAPAVAATAAVGKMPTYAPTYMPPEAPAYTASKTPWGDPDISGVYDFMTFIRMERPPEYRDKKTLTPAELKAYFKQYAPNEDACGTGSREGEV